MFYEQINDDDDDDEIVFTQSNSVASTSYAYR